MKIEKIEGDKSGRDVIKNNIFLNSPNITFKIDSGLSHPIFEKFKSEKIYIILSNLFSPNLFYKESKIKVATLLKYNPDDNTVMGINSGFPVTGIWDCFGLATIIPILTKLKIEIELGTDFISKQKLTQNNIVLIGGITSNNSATYIYNNLSDEIKNKFGFNENGSVIRIGNKNLKGGDKAFIYFGENSFNKDKKILWLAGIGSVGTGSAAHFLAFNSTEISKNILDSKTWVVGLRGETDKEGKLYNSYKECELNL